MSFLGVDIRDPLIRAAVEGAAFRNGLPVERAGEAPRGRPWAVARSAAEQESRGTSADAPVVAVWNSKLEGGGGDPFSHGLVRHLVSTDTLLQAHRVESWMVALSRGDDLQAGFYNEHSMTYEAELDGPRARPSLEAAVVNDLARSDVDGRTSARVIKALVALVGLCEPGTEGTRLAWPAYVQFGADLDQVWLSITSPAVVRVESVLAEMSRGYHGLFRGRVRSRIPALGWFFAFRQVDRLGIFLSPGETEIVATWDRMRTGLSWDPELHLGVPGRSAWRRAVRHAVNWTGQVSQGTLRHSARILDVSALGVFLETDEVRGFFEDQPVSLELRLPAGPMRLSGQVRYASAARRPGLAIEFSEESRDLGHELERLTLAA